MRGQTAMRVGRLIVATIAVWAFTPASKADNMASTSPSQITPGTLYPYTSFGGGDVVFQLSRIA